MRDFYVRVEEINNVEINYSFYKKDVRSQQNLPFVVIVDLDLLETAGQPYP
jgi:predicted component of type VI protein secretion system